MSVFAIIMRRQLPQHYDTNKHSISFDGDAAIAPHYRSSIYTIIISATMVQRRTLLLHKTGLDTGTGYRLE